MTDAEARKRAARALALYEQALNVAMEVVRDRWPLDTRTTDEASLTAELYRGHAGFRRLLIRMEDDA